MDGFERVADVASVPPGTMLSVRVRGEEVLLANVEGNFYAMGAVCTHQRWDLSEGALEGTKVTCAGHGSVWDLATGKAVFDEPLEDLPVYEVMVAGGSVLVRAR